MQIFGNVKIYQRHRDHEGWMGSEREITRVASAVTLILCARYGTLFVHTAHTLDYNASARTIFY